MRFVFLFLFSTVFGQVLELQSFRDLSQHLTRDTLLVLDIDDTLLIPEQMLGCDEWFLYRLQTNGTLEKTLAEWEGIRHLTKMEVVEPGTEEIILELQSRGVAIMGLTTQGLALASRTVQQLESNNIDLSLSAPIEQDVFFAQNDHGILYRHGVLFTSGQKKGEALFQLCNLSGFAPKRIVFVNDKGTHIADIDGSAAVRDVEFLGLRYAYSDSRKAAFSREIADIQFTRSSFNHILSDEEASELLQPVYHCIDSVGEDQVSSGSLNT